MQLVNTAIINTSFTNTAVLEFTKVFSKLASIPRKRAKEFIVSTKMTNATMKRYKNNFI